MEEKNKDPNKKMNGRKKSKDHVVKKKLSKYKVDPRKTKNIPKNKKKSGPAPAKKPSSAR